MNRLQSPLQRPGWFHNPVLWDSLLILALYFITAFFIYKMPETLRLLLFTLFFISFLKSKKDYFWLAFFFALCTGPAHFFFISEEVHIGRLPIVQIGGGINISVTEIFLGLAILKAIIRGRKKHLFLSRPLLIVLSYAVLLFFVSFAFYDTELIRFLKDVRYFFYYFTLIPLTYLIFRQGEGEKFLYCLFPFVFLSFISAVYYILVGDYFINLLAPGVRSQLFLGIVEGGTRLTRYGTSGKGEYLLLIISYISSFFLLFRTYNTGKRNYYFLLIAGMSYVTLLLTATRVWFVVMTFILIAALVLLQRNLKFISGIVLIILLFYIPFQSVPRIQQFSRKSWQRVESVFYIDDPDSMAYQMIESKEKNRLQDTLMYIKLNPWMGWGASNQFHQYTRGGDVGNFNLVLQVGIIGFLLYANFWVRFFLQIRRINRNISAANPYHKTLHFFNIALAGLLIAHFTTHQVFFMITSQSNSIFIVIFVFLAGYFSLDALKRESEIRSAAADT